MARRHLTRFFAAFAFACLSASTPACAAVESEDEDEDATEDDDGDIHFRPSNPSCPNCRYRTATFSVSSAQLQGGTVAAATMHTSVTHSTCPYSGYGSPCTMDMSFSVTCKTPGAGTFEIRTSPNGYSTGATGSGSVQVTVALPGGGASTFSVPASFGNPTTTVPPSTPCGDHEVWTITD
jgi:hypothetical protein